MPEQKFSLLIFSKNEIEAMRTIMPRIKKEWVDEVLVVDGGSTDGTIEYARGLGFNVYIQKSKGILAGYKEGIEVSVGDAFIIFTPDGNMIPEKIPELIAKMNEGYDMVIVSRYKDGAKSKDDTIISGLGNWVFTKMVNVLFKAHYTDVLGAYRAYRKGIFEKAGIVIKNRPIETRICIKAAINKEINVCEISGDEPKRIAGKSYRKIIKNGFNELFIIFEEFFHIPSILVDKFLKF
jgi:glycosyltransferase involved in cell wall biosynthesis